MTLAVLAVEQGRPEGGGRRVGFLKAGKEMGDLFVLPCKPHLSVGPLQPASAFSLLPAERPVAVDWAVAREKYQAAQAEGVPDGEWPTCVNWGGQFQGLGEGASVLPFKTSPLFTVKRLSSQILEWLASHVAVTK